MKYEDKIGMLFIHMDSARLLDPPKPQKENDMTRKKINAIENCYYLWGLSIAMAKAIGFADDDINSIGVLFEKISDYLLSIEEG